MGTKSSTSSTNQPQRTKKLYQFKDYAVSGGKALSAQIDIRDFGAYYEEDERSSGGYESDWSSVRSSRYIPNRIHNAADAIAARDSFQFPIELRNEAKRHARSLAQVFVEVNSKTVLRDQISGRMDSHKLSQLAMHTAAGTYDPQKVRPFRRNIQSPVKPPVIAIVASAGNAEMWSDDTYIPRVMELTLALSWATEAAGLKTYASLVQSHCDLHFGTYKQAIQAIMLAQPNVRVSPSTFAVGLHRDMWRYGLISTSAASYEENAKLYALRYQRAFNEYGVGYTFPCMNGGQGVTWARSILQADVVIGIGHLTDLGQADIQLKGQFKLAEAVKDVMQQAKKLGKNKR